MFHVEQFALLFCGAWYNGHMSNSKGLGKGLGALISMFDEDMDVMKHAEGNAGRAEVEGRKSGGVIEPRGTVAQLLMNGVSEIDIGLIDNNSSQPRKVFDADAMRELEQSILANGVLQPILVNKVGSRYMIVAGERRWRASKNVGLKTIPALVRNYSQKQISEIALVENLMRADLNDIEVAIGIKKLMDTHLMTQEQVSKVLGLSRPAIANFLRYLNLPKEVQALLESGKISAGHAKILAGVTDRALCVNLAGRCSNGMSVRELERAAEGTGKGGDAKAKNVGRSIELRAFELSLTQYFATKVSILGDDNHGKIVIEYANRKNLERILDKMK